MTVVQNAREAMSAVAAIQVEIQAEIPVEIEATTVVAPASFLSSHLGVSGGPTLMVLVRAAVLK